MQRVWVRHGELSGQRGLPGQNWWEMAQSERQGHVMRPDRWVGPGHEHFLGHCKESVDLGFRLAK